MAERRSALAGALARGGRDGADGRRRLRLSEIRGWSLVKVAAYAAQQAGLIEPIDYSVVKKDELDPRFATPAAVGTSALPGGVAVEVEATFELG